MSHILFQNNVIIKFFPFVYETYLILIICIFFTFLLLGSATEWHLINALWLWCTLMTQWCWSYWSGSFFLYTQWIVKLSIYSLFSVLSFILLSPPKGYEHGDEACFWSVVNLSYYFYGPTIFYPTNYFLFLRSANVSDSVTFGFYIYDFIQIWIHLHQSVCCNSVTKNVFLIVQSLDTPWHFLCTF